MRKLRPTETRAAYTYDPYGTTTVNNGAGPANPWRYTGTYQDSTGFYKMGVRYYAPSLMRWTPQDPIGGPTDVQQLNRFGYTGGDPVNHADQTGLSTVCDIQGCKATCGWHECTGESEDGYRVWGVFDDACYGFGAVSFVARRTNPWVAGGCIVYGGIRRATK